MSVVCACSVCLCVCARMLSQHFPLLGSFPQHYLAPQVPKNGSIRLSGLSALGTWHIPGQVWAADGSQSLSGPQALDPAAFQTEKVVSRARSSQPMRKLSSFPSVVPPSRTTNFSRAAPGLALVLPRILAQQVNGQGPREAPRDFERQVKALDVYQL